MLETSAESQPISHRKNPVCLYPFSCGIPEPRSFFQKVWIVQQELQTEVISWLDLAEVTLKQKIKTRPNFNVKAFSGDDNIDVSQLMSGIELSKYCNVNSHGNSTQVQAKPDSIFR